MKKSKKKTSALLPYITIQGMGIATLGDQRPPSDDDIKEWQLSTALTEFREQRALRGAAAPRRRCAKCAIRGKLVEICTVRSATEDVAYNMCKSCVDHLWDGSLWGSRQVVVLEREQTAPVTGYLSSRKSFESYTSGGCDACRLTTTSTDVEKQRVAQLTGLCMVPKCREDFAEAIDWETENLRKGVEDKLWYIFHIGCLQRIPVAQLPDPASKEERVETSNAASDCVKPLEQTVEMAKGGEGYAAPDTGEVVVPASQDSEEEVPTEVEPFVEVDVAAVAEPTREDEEPAPAGEREEDLSVDPEKGESAEPVPVETVAEEVRDYWWGCGTKSKKKKKKSIPAKSRNFVGGWDLILEPPQEVCNSAPIEQADAIEPAPSAEDIESTTGGPLTPQTTAATMTSTSNPFNNLKTLISSLTSAQKELTTQISELESRLAKAEQSRDINDHILQRILALEQSFDESGIDGELLEELKGKVVSMEAQHVEMKTELDKHERNFRELQEAFDFEG